MNIEMTSKLSKSASKVSKQNTIKCTNFNAGNSMDSKLSKCSFSGPAWHQTETEDSRCSDSGTLELESSSEVMSQTASTPDNDQASMDNNASSKSGRLTASDYDESAPSDLSDSRVSRNCFGSNDYLDNFPYAPPSRKPIPKPSTSIWPIKPK